MFLTIEDNGKNETFGDCIEYLEKVLPTHSLLTQSERDVCKDSIEKLKGVFRRFYERK